MGRRPHTPDDLIEIERKYRVGMSLRRIAAMHGISKTTVANLADRHGWTVNEALRELPPDVRETQTALAASAPQTEGEKRIVTLGKRTPENLAEILAHMRTGLTGPTAAAMVGWNKSMLRRVLDEDEGFAALYRNAQAQAGSQMESAVFNSALRGDAKAAQDYLTAQERGSWGRDGAGGGNAGVVVVVNLDRDAEQPPTVVVDAEAIPD